MPTPAENTPHEYRPKKLPTHERNKLGFIVINELGYVLFVQLRKDGVKLPNGNPLPSLFEFTELELSANPRLLSFLLPPGTTGEVAPGSAADRAAAMEGLDGAKAGGAMQQVDTGGDGGGVKMGGREA